MLQILHPYTTRDVCGPCDIEYSTFCQDQHFFQNVCLHKSCGILGSTFSTIWVRATFIFQGKIWLFVTVSYYIFLISLNLFFDQFYGLISSAFKVHCLSTILMRTIGAHMCRGFSDVHFLLVSNKVRPNV